jgi:hypothetical protein
MVHMNNSVVAETHMQYTSNIYLSLVVLLYKVGSEFSNLQQLSRCLNFYFMFKLLGWFRLA